MGMSVSIIVVSDRCYQGTETDRSGATLQDAFAAENYRTLLTIVPDETDLIREAVLADNGADIILTSGGTGPSPRDITPEACADFFVRDFPGISQLLMQKSLEETPFAAFSRGKAGLTASGQLLVNLPGSQKAAALAARVLIPLLPHLMEQVNKLPDDGLYVEH